MLVAGSAMYGIDCATAGRLMEPEGTLSTIEKATQSIRCKSIALCDDCKNQEINNRDSVWRQ